MREVLVALPLLSLVGGLAGCGKKSDDTYAWVPPESPPPQPPTCPETSELSNIRLADGQYADVRIIQIDSARLYIPTRWLIRALIDHNAAKYRLDEKTYRREVVLRYDLGSFKPDIYLNECPGIVHAANLDGVPREFGSRMNTTEIGLYAADNIRGAARDLRFGDPETNAIGIQASVMTDGRRMPTPWTNGMSGWSQPHPAFFITMWKGWDTLSPKGQDKARDEMDRLGEWLLTRPKDRDENEIFFRGIRE